MYVRLAVAWTDPAGVVHAAGEVVDIDAVTLAELEEQGMVEDPNNPEPTSIGPGPGSEEPAVAATSIGPGPGSEPDASTEAIGPGPGSEEPDATA